MAGGKSRRLGTDKSLLRVDGEWITARVVRLLAELCDDLLIVSNEVGRFATLPVRVVPDVQPGLGPLVGILSGLQAMRHEQGIFVACDMPLLNTNLLRHMMARAVGCDLVLPRIGNKIEPLHAIYSRACIPAIEALLAAGELRIAGLLPRVRICYMEQQELEEIDPDHLSFFNVNTPADLDALRTLMQP